MKSLILALLTVSSVAQAKDIVCVDKNIQDNAVTATFHNMENDRAVKTVTLEIPKDMFSFTPYLGVCRADKGAIELAYTCNVLTSTDSGYVVRIYSNGSAQLTASYQPWNMIGKGEIQTIPCER